MFEKSFLFIVILRAFKPFHTLASGETLLESDYTLPWCNSTSDLGKQIGMTAAIKKTEIDPLFIEFMNMGVHSESCWTTVYPEDPDRVKYAKERILRCMDDLAPEVEDWRTSFGLVQEMGVGPRTACAKETACMDVNDFLHDGTLELVGAECRGLKVLYEMMSKPQSIATMQLTLTCWSISSHGCWGTLSTGEDIACPVYGPTYKGNELFAYFFGGVKRLSQMPRCRMPLGEMETVFKGFF